MIRINYNCIKICLNLVHYISDTCIYFDNLKEEGYLSILLQQKVISFLTSNKYLLTYISWAKIKVVTIRCAEDWKEIFIFVFMRFCIWQPQISYCCDRKKGKKSNGFFLEAIFWQQAKERKDVSRLNKDQDLPLACKFPLKDNRKSCSK